MLHCVHAKCTVAARTCERREARRETYTQRQREGGEGEENRRNKGMEEWRNGVRLHSALSTASTALCAGTWSRVGG